jgi:hypothetical protein
MQSINGSNANSLLPGFRFSLVSLNMAFSPFLRLDFWGLVLCKGKPSIVRATLLPGDVLANVVEPVCIHGPGPGGLCLSIWEAEVALIFAPSRNPESPDKTLTALTVSMGFTGYTEII